MIGDGTMVDIKNYDELVEQTKNNFFLLTKFSSRKNIEMLQLGKIYMKNLQYYIDLETTTDDEDVGDKYDGLLSLKDVNINMYKVDTKESIARFNASTATMNLGYKKSPVFCMFILDNRNLTMETRNGDELLMRYDFSDEQRDKLIKFGDTVLLITDPKEFFQRMKEGFNKAVAGHTRDRVKYYQGNTKEHLLEVCGDNNRIAFWKRKKYEHQQEYRFLAFDMKVEDHLIIDIGDISDISQLESAEKVLNTFIEVKHKLEKITN